MEDKQLEVQGDPEGRQESNATNVHEFYAKLTKIERTKGGIIRRC